MFMAKTAPLNEISVKYVELTYAFGEIFTEFRAKFQKPARRGGNSGFSISGSSALKTHCFIPIKSSPQIQESMCCGAKYFYNIPHVFYCKVLS